MKITNILKEKKVLLSFEIFPPKQQANFDNVVSTAKELSALNPDFMSITWGAGGTTKGNTVEIASKLIGFGTPALAHLTCVGNTKDFNKIEKNDKKVQLFLNKLEELNIILEEMQNQRENLNYMKKENDNIVKNFERAEYFVRYLGKGFFDLLITLIFNINIFSLSL